jgi:hypothetical protein
MGRRFSSHGLVITDAHGIWQTLHGRLLPAACFAAPVLSAPAFLPGASPSIGAPQAAVFLSASSSDHLSKFPPPPASTSRRSSAGHPKMCRLRSAALHKRRSIVRFNEQAAVHGSLSANRFIAFCSPRTFCRNCF